MDTVSKGLCRMYIVRHGETQWNVEQRIQGQEDSPITKNGENQAKELGKLLKDISFDAVFSSDLLRAKKTAEIIVLEKKLAVVTTALIRERAFGTLEGQPLMQLREFDEALNKLTKAERFSYKAHPDIESDAEVMERFIRFIREVAVGFAGKNVLVVTHGGTLRSFLIHIGYVKYDTFVRGSIKNTAYIVLDTDGVDFFVKGTFGIVLTTTNS